jgi:hypothetical protein
VGPASSTASALPVSVLQVPAGQLVRASPEQIVICLSVRTVSVRRRADPKVHPAIPWTRQGIAVMVNASVSATGSEGSLRTPAVARSHASTQCAASEVHGGADLGTQHVVPKVGSARVPRQACASTCSRAQAHVTETPLSSRIAGTVPASIQEHGIVRRKCSFAVLAPVVLA